MNFYEIATEGTFSAAHRLVGYEGNCSRQHGHNWRVVLYIPSPVLNDQQMVIDFKRIKYLLMKFLKSKFDHKAILQDCPQNKPLIELLQKEDFEQVCVTDFSPSAESFARYIFHYMNKCLKDEKVGVSKVEVYETEKSKASYCQTTNYGLVDFD